MQQACEHKAGVSYCPGTRQCKEPSKAKVGKSLQSQPWLDKSRGVSHVYTMSFSLNKEKKKQERKLSGGEIHTWELPYGPCPAKHRETREKRKWKNDQSLTETNKRKILFKKKIDNDSAISMSKGMK